MAYIYYNPNPVAANVPDCATRAIAKALGTTWEDAHIKIFLNSLKMGDTMDSDNVWGAVLRMNGFRKAIIPNECPDCYTAEDFCNDNPHGIFVLGFGRHTATVVDGDLYDTWDSSRSVPIYYWYKEEEDGPISRTDRSEPATNATAGSK